MYSFLLFFPFLLQMIAIGIDEIYFHYKRGLPKWERIGHPIDTLSTLLCLSLVLLLPFTKTTFIIYCSAAALSCLMVTKDEFVHKHHCTAQENWLHACLFLLHPVILINTALVWTVVAEQPSFAWLAAKVPKSELLELGLTLQVVAMTLFLLYQVVFWNFIWRDKPVIKN